MCLALEASVILPHITPSVNIIFFYFFKSFIEKLIKEQPSCSFGIDFTGVALG
jgi:hypothetical protein